MKILTYGDCHFSQFSSTVRSRGAHYSTRLENEIKSINYAERTAVETGCGCIVILGDFFDKPDLTAEEISAFKEIQWAALPHFILTGNHEMALNDLSYSSAQLLSLIPMATVINKPFWIRAGRDNLNVKLLFLPYILESNRQSFSYYKNHTSCLYDDRFIEDEDSKLVVFSHNDIQGIRYGQFESKIGFNVSEISDNCDLYINGHLHNQEQINNKIINLGNLTGQNFSEDALKYAHCFGIVDLDTLTLSCIVNPYAFNFYKVEINSIEDFKQILKFTENAVISAKVKESLINDFKLFIQDNNINPVNCRIVTVRDVVENTNTDNPIITVDHIEQFKNYILENVGSSDVILQELSYLN